MYHRKIVRVMRQHSGGDVELWLGDYARGRGGRPVVSFVQGPPGTDATSIVRHRDEVERLAGRWAYRKLALAAKVRMSIGLPKFNLSDKIIVGSQWSKSNLVSAFGIDPDSIEVLPYPIDLRQFCPPTNARSTRGPLRALWLGRFIPRKRLALFLSGLRLAIEAGEDIAATIVGRSGFVPNYERLIEQFPYPSRLDYRTSISRDHVPELLSQVDVICQPSDNENFGSSVAEALACGVPAIVGATNGTGDYVCERSVRLKDDQPETMAAAIVAMADAKKRGELVDPRPSRFVAEKFFHPDIVTDQLEKILRTVVE